MKKHFEKIDLAIIFLAISLIFPMPALTQSANCNCAPLDPAAPHMSNLRITSISLSSDTLGPAPLERAAEMWNSTCSVVENKNHPVILTTMSAEAAITVIVHPGETDQDICQGASGCGCTEIIVDDNTGQLKDGVIHLFDTALANGFDCAPTWSDTIIHEIGHNLGLANVPSSCHDECAGRIMGRPGSEPGDIAVGPNDCIVIDFIWFVPLEPTDSGGEEGSDCGRRALLWRPTVDVYQFLPRIVR